MSAQDAQARALALQFAVQVSQDPEAVLAAAARYLEFLTPPDAGGPAWNPSQAAADEPGWTKR